MDKGSRICPECGTRTEAEVCERDGRPTVDAGEMLREVADPLLGTTIGGKYRVDRRLGRGGYGSVYRARHLETGGPVAVKLLRPELHDDEHVVRRFYLEAQNTHRLQHPNTVRVVDFGRSEGGFLYLIMEYIDGRSLMEVIRAEERLAPVRAVRILSQVLKSLWEAHGKGLVHRDIKPQNIMLCDQAGEPDFVRVLDFGVSRLIDSSGASTTGLVGTPYYMAPEQWLGAAVDARTDLYALGCVTFQMLSGRMPFDVPTGPQGTAMAWMNAHLRQPPTALQELLGQAVPGPLAETVMALLAKNPDGRPPSAEAVLQSLGAVSSAEAPTADHPAPLRPDAPRVPQGGGAPTLEAGGHEAEVTLQPAARAALAAAVARAEPEVAEPRPRRVWRAPLAVLATLAAAATGLWVGLGGPAQPPPDPLPSPVAAGAPLPRAPAPSTTAAAVGPVVAAPAVPIARLRLVTTPPGAEVLRNSGAVLGQTPLELPRNDDLADTEVTLRLPGHRERRASLVFPAPGEAREVLVALLPWPTWTLRPTPSDALVRVPETGDVFRGAQDDAPVPAPILELLETGRSVSLVVSAPGHETETLTLRAEDLEALDYVLAPRLPAKARARSGMTFTPAPVP